MQKVFSASSPNFWLSLMVFGFSVAALFGIKFPASPGDTAAGIAHGLAGGHPFSIIGLLTTSVAGPVIQFIRKKPNVPVASILGSANFWVYLGGFLVSIAMLLGIGIPADAPAKIAEAVLAKQWGALATLAFTAIVQPIWRYFNDKKAAGSTV